MGKTTDMRPLRNTLSAKFGKALRQVFVAEHSRWSGGQLSDVRGGFGIWITGSIYTVVGTGGTESRRKYYSREFQLSFLNEPFGWMRNNNY